MEQIAQALNKFQSNLPEVKLDATVKVQTKAGGSYNFKYATYANIVKTVLPPLIENDMAFTQTFGDGCLITSLFHISGESIVSKIPINLDGCTMQEIGSRISYLKRYSLSAILGIVAEEDDDANIADGNSYQKNKPEKRPRTTTQNNDPERSGKNLQGEITKPQKGKLWAMMKEQGMDDKQAGAFFAFKNPTTKNDASEFIENFDVYLTEYMETLDGR